MRTSAFAFLILIGAHVFNPFLALTQIPTYLTEMLIGTNLGPHGILFILLITFIVLGMFLEGFAILVLTLPIVHPLIIELGFDPIEMLRRKCAQLGIDVRKFKDRIHHHAPPSGTRSGDIDESPVEELPYGAERRRLPRRVHEDLARTFGKQIECLDKERALVAKPPIETRATNLGRLEQLRKGSRAIALSPEQQHRRFYSVVPVEFCRSGHRIGLQGTPAGFIDSSRKERL